MARLVSAAALLCWLGCAAGAAGAPHHCGLPKERGACADFAVRWYFDAEYGGCLRFWHGGCGGNGNRFASEAECVGQCVSPAGDARCRLPAVRGACKRAKPRWFSDPASGACRRFTYSGCLGNDNRFGSEVDCQARCGGVLAAGRPPPPPPLPAIGAADCQLPDRVAGDCRQYTIRHSWVAARRQCAPFYYGGCGGNANNFASAEKCQEVCRSPPPGVAPRRGEPRRPHYGPEAGPPHYASRDTSHDQATESPEPVADSTDVCSLPEDGGQCLAYFPRYFYSTARGQCLQFIYGGCQGNANRFNTLDECTATCAGRHAEPAAVATEPPTEIAPRHEEPRRPHYRSETEPPYEPYQPETEPPYYQPETEAPWYRPETEPPYEPYQPETEPPYYQPETEAPWYRPETEQPYEPHQPETEAPYYQPETEAPWYRPETAPPYYQPETEAPWYRPETEPPYEPYQPETEPPYYQPETEAPWYRPETKPLHISTTEDAPHDQTTESPEPVADSTEVCSLPEEGGRCKAYIPSYFYSTARGQCLEFIYGGCQGNANRFDTLYECEATCPEPHAAVTTEPSGVDPCRLPPQQGPCRGHIPQFYFNEARRRCFTFGYGGCGGNANRFATAAACAARCEPAAERSDAVVEGTVHYAPAGDDAADGAGAGGRYLPAGPADGSVRYRPVGADGDAALPAAGAHADAEAGTVHYRPEATADYGAAGYDYEVAGGAGLFGFGGHGQPTDTPTTADYDRYDGSDYDYYTDTDYYDT